MPGVLKQTNTLVMVRGNNIFDNNVHVAINT